jgi:tetratricopeptide (TPR) repeat protein
LEKLIRQAISERAQHKADDIKNYLIEQDYHNEIVKAFRSKKHPSAVSSFFELSRAHFRSNDVEKAIEAARDGLRECEDLFSTQYLEGLQTISQLFIETGSYDKAATYLETAVKFTQAVKGHHPFLGKMVFYSMS